jgi:hypothetical protein
MNTLLAIMCIVAGIFCLGLGVRLVRQNKRINDALYFRDQLRIRLSDANLADILNCETLEDTYAVRKITQERWDRYSSVSFEEMLDRKRPLTIKEFYGDESWLDSDKSYQ